MNILNTQNRRPGRTWLLGMFVGLISICPTNDASAIEKAEEPVGRAVKALRLDTAKAISRSREYEISEMTAPILDLCRLHDELVRHPKYSDGGVLVGCRARISTRLTQIVRDLQKISVDSSSREEEAGYSFLEKHAATSYFHERHLRMAGFLAGGPAGQFQWMSGNFAPGDENAAALISLIQQTINPDIWRNNGGDASITWWQPSQVLVVNADSMTQDRIQALLIGLRGR
jgi:hypothetical protein